MSIILIVSILIQLFAAFYSLRLIKITGKVKSWLAISIAIILMTIRRSVTLYGYITGNLISSLDWVEEIVALLTSFLMAIGIVWIAPIFRSIKLTNKALIRSNRALKTLSACNQIIIHENNESILMKRICRVIVELGQYRMAWVGFAVDDVEKSVLPVADFGFVDGYLDQTKITWDESETGMGPTGMAIRTGQTCIVRDVQSDPNYHPWRKNALNRGYRSTIASPLRGNNHVFGALNIYSNEKDAFDENEVKLLTELTNDLSYAINAIRIKEQRNQSEQQLFESQQRLVQLVERSPLGIVEWSTDLEIEAWNPAAEMIFGYSKEEMIGKHSDQLLPGTSNFKFDNNLYEGSSDKGFIFDATESHTKNNEIIICNWYNFPLIDKEGQLYRFASIIEDVTDQTNAEVMRENQLQRLNALRHIDMSILGSFDLNIVLNTIVEECIDKLQVDAISIYKYDPLQNVLEYKCSSGFKSTDWQDIQLKPGEGLAGKVIVERKMVLISDLSEIKEKISRFSIFMPDKFNSYIGIPLISKGEIKGVFEVFNKTKISGQEAWLDFLHMLTGQAAIAIDNAEQYEKLQISNMDLASAYDKTIEGWSKTLELRDQVTEGHAVRVTEITLRLAETFELRKDELVHIRRGALLHDIGKIILPDSILHKPGPLSEEEWILMKQHPQIAYKLLSPIKYLRPALNIPYMHHEKWDGSGYPNGLKGDQIPLEARIFAVVDVWDALSSDRPYRKAWHPKKVTEYIKEQAGKHFDPDVVMRFLPMLEEKKNHSVFMH
ncbi:MAG TPA: hypothetical protein DCK95_05040 [Anaerolineaceae bacterium]|nr:hypothetical protein [Anaerolineaceae bacterium]